MSLKGQKSTTPTHLHHRLEPVVRFVTAQIAKQQLNSARLERSFFSCAESATDCTINQFNLKTAPGRD